ncbi:MAG: Ig-like domain-containing protein [Bacillota bacterium]|nr:Ig-like domain-containing protein [Bacillota bacterium]
MKVNTKAKLIAILMSVMMVFTVTPAMAFADQEAIDNESVAEESADDGAMLNSGLRVTYHFGNDKKALAKKIYNWMKANNPDLSPKLSGEKLSFLISGQLPGYAAGQLPQSYMRNVGVEELDRGIFRYNGSLYTGDVGPKPASSYKTVSQYQADMNTFIMEPMGPGSTYYIQWYKPVKVVADITVDAPVCGTEVVTTETFRGRSQTNVPAVSFPDGKGIVETTNAYWAGTPRVNSSYISGTIEGGETYNAMVCPSLAYGYCFSEDSVITVNGQQPQDMANYMRGPIVCNAAVTAKHAWDRGEVQGDGSILYTCTSCGETKVEAQPAAGADGTALGKGASFLAADEAIRQMSSDDDPAGTVLDPLRLKSVKQTKTDVTLTWNAQASAVTYLIYGNKCGAEHKMELIDETNSPSYNVTGLQAKTYHKYMLVALDGSNEVLTASMMIHVATKGGKPGNNKAVTIKIKKGKKWKAAKTASVATGKTLKLKCKATKAKKVKVYKHVGLRYESSDINVAAVSPNGLITAMAPGKCAITVYAQNGVSKTITITVK